MPSVDSKLIEILVCPECKATLRYEKDDRELVCKDSGLAFPIKNGVPIMLVEHARVLGPHE